MSLIEVRCAVQAPIELPLIIALRPIKEFRLQPPCRV